MAERAVRGKAASLSKAPKCWAWWRRIDAEGLQLLGVTRGLCQGLAEQGTCQ